MEEVSFDFEVIGDSDRDPDMVDVLLVATRTENVEQRQVAVEAAGLTARVVDVEAFAVENACQLLTHQMPDAGVDKFVAIVDFGASTTTFSVLKGSEGHLHPRLRVRRQQLTEEIMRTYGLSMEDAGRAKKEGGLPSNYQPEVLDAFIDASSRAAASSTCRGSTGPRPWSWPGTEIMMSEAIGQLFCGQDWAELRSPGPFADYPEFEAATGATPSRLLSCRYFDTFGIAPIFPFGHSLRSPPSRSAICGSAGPWRTASSGLRRRDHDGTVPATRSSCSRVLAEQHALATTIKELEGLRPASS